MSSEDAKSDQREEGGMLPAVLAGVGILAVTAFMLFGMGDDEKDRGGKKGADAAAKSGKNSGRRGGKDGGVARRDADGATTNGAGPRAAPRPSRMGGLTVTEVGSPGAARQRPNFKNQADELAFVQKQLSEARRVLTMRRKGMTKIRKVEESAARGPNPDEALEKIGKKKDRLQKNIDHSVDKVADLEQQVRDLGGDPGATEPAPAPAPVPGEGEAAATAGEPEAAPTEAAPAEEAPAEAAPAEAPAP